jgi:outer membrane protein assembly factor BamB
MPGDREPPSLQHPRTKVRARALLLIGLAGVVIAAVCLALFTPLFSALFHPSSATPGSVAPATAPNTAMFGQDAWHSRVDSSEQRLAYANVSHLVSDWTSQPTGGSLFSSPVVAGGVVYVGSFDGMLYAFNAGGCKGAEADCAPLWTSTFLGDRIFATPVYAYHLPGVVP